MSEDSCNDPAGGAKPEELPEGETELDADPETSSVEGETEELSPEQLLANGKKCLAAGDAGGAVEYFQESCSILADMYGQVSKELAEPYYLYGRALLELAREKSAMFGNGLSVSGEANIPNSVSSSSSNGPSLSGQVSASSDSAGRSITNNSGSGMEGSEVKEDEEESDLQLSWEVLELARVICQKESDKEHQLKLSDVNLALGEVGLESDQYEQAITDLQASLRLREFALEPTDRRIAEVHFSLGLAYTLARQVEQAIASYKSSKFILIKRKEEIESQLVSMCEDDDQRERRKQEEMELAELIPDIDSKIADMEELKKVLEERENAENQVETFTGFSSPTNENAAVNTLSVRKGPATDISHLIRKRKRSDEEVNENLQTKQVCAETSLLEPPASEQ